jgi:hypothetical protein
MCVNRRKDLRGFYEALIAPPIMVLEGLVLEVIRHLLWTPWPTVQVPPNLMKSLMLVNM